MQEEKIYIKMLGAFEISCGDSYLTSGDMSGQLCALLGYLVCHKTATMDSITEAIWPEGVANPPAALKNLVYRMRKVLADSGFHFAKELLVSSQGTYKINSELNIVLDTEMFEQAFLKAQAVQTPLEKIALYKEGLALYRGEFMEEFAKFEWTLPLAQHYHSLFFKNVYLLLDIYCQQEDYPSVLRAARKALTVDKFEEQAHQYMMYALHKSGDNSKALAYYTYATEIFYNGLGVELSESMQQLYASISKLSKVSATDIQTIYKELAEPPDELQNALFCDLEVFKQLYHFNSRGSVRSGTTFFIGLLSLNFAEDASEKREVAMDFLKSAIARSLRKGDAYTRCSPTQYLIMLPMINFENGLVVLKRVEKNFRGLFPSRKVTLSHNLQSAQPPFWD